VLKRQPLSFVQISRRGEKRDQHRGAVSIRIMLTRIIVCILLALISAQGLSAADFTMKVTDKNYLDTQGFSVFLYDSTYHPVFVDQKNTAMEMILHGQRIATNGDVRLMPTPEQWDLVLMRLPGCS
jgi:hypothetical protein